MPRWQRAYVVAACALIGAAFAYALCDWAQWPRLAYLPVVEELTMHPRGDAVAITYLGNLAWGLGGAASGTLVGAAVCAVCALAKRSLSGRTLRLLGAWAITAVVMAGLYYTWTVWPW
jgi:hypothetical protein